MNSRLHVVVGILFNSNKDKILISKRTEKSELSDFWEFPGGKVDNNETFEIALKREIKEELSINIKIVDLISSQKHKDEKIDVNVHYYLCDPLDEKIFLSEHEDMKWVKKIELNNFKMAPGDSKIIKFLI